MNLHTSFPSRRSPILATNGIVATSHPLAAIAGLRTLQAGGNAADAAVVTAITLSVVEPFSTGAGGDAFALVRWANDGKVSAMNGSGHSPAAADAEQLRARGWTTIPDTSPFSVTVPGSVDAWHEMLDTYGSISWVEAFEPAIQYAEQGFPISPVVAGQWRGISAKLRGNEEATRVYLPKGRPPHVGELFCQPDLARTYRDLAQQGPTDFYTGSIGKAVADCVQALDGWLDASDLRSHRTTWGEPISTEYRGVTIYEHPPNGQGLLALLALNMLSATGVNDMQWGTPETTHLLVESMKLAFADGHRYIVDPEATDLPLMDVLSRDYASHLGEQISMERAAAYSETGIPSAGGTVYISVVDGDGNAVSFINSLYGASGIVAPGTGVLLQNRGQSFSLDPDSPHYLLPGRRPYHTIIPAMASRDGRLWMSFGLMGGHMQPQGHLQLIANLLDFGMSYQEAIDAPRWRLDPDGSLAVEPGFPASLRAELKRLGHKLKPAEPAFSNGFGGGQIIAIDDEEQVLWGASEPRKDGCAVGW